MSGRGARSRKAIVKEIEKKEKKEGKQKAVEAIRRPHDVFAEWAPSPSLSPRDATGTGIARPTAALSSDGSRTSELSRSDSINPTNTRNLPNATSYASSSRDPLEFRNSHRPHTSQSGSTSLSDVSSKGKEHSKYKAKGKETKAPRGRGGGVPIKKPTITTPLPPVFRSETSASYSPSSNKTWINFRIWEGGETGLKPYGGFDYVGSRDIC